MTSAHFRVSAFGDEIADDLATQLDVLAGERIAWLELRGAWGKNVLDLSDGDLAQARSLLAARGFAISAVGSPVGKSGLSEPRAFEEARLDRAVHVAAALGTRLIRVFSFFVPPHDFQTSRDEVLERISRLTARAAEREMTLVLENEKGVYGDTPARCRDLLDAVGSPSLRQAFDPANFVQVGVRPMQDAWPVLAPYTAHVHIKDARFSDGAILPAGEGDGAIPALLETLARGGYHGFLTLEPHLQYAGPAGGHSGPDGMRIAAHALRILLASLSASAPME
jgi:sugar phosphate isomerase/epimerase